MFTVSAAQLLHPTLAVIGSILLFLVTSCFCVICSFVKCSCCNTCLFLQVVIFVKSVQRCMALAQLLVEQNFPAIAIHSSMVQAERLVSPQHTLAILKTSHLLSPLQKCFTVVTIDSIVPRLSRYQQFKDFQRRILVATNLFGRGMDIERVNIVFNYDMPEDSDTYLHRVRPLASTLRIMRPLTITNTVLAFGPIEA